MDRSNPIVVKSKALALRIIKLSNYLRDEKREYVLSKQVLKSGTSIGANIREALRGYSKREFYARLNIALREASETEYWLELLNESGYITEQGYESIYQDTQEMIRLLVAIIKTRTEDEE